MLHPQVGIPSKVLGTAAFIDKNVNLGSSPLHTPHGHQSHQVEAYHHSSDGQIQVY